MNTKMVDNFIEKELLSEEALRNNYERELIESQNALCAISGMDNDGFSKLNENISKLSVEEIKDMSDDNILNILGEKISNTLDKNLAHATLEKRKSFKKDFVLLIKEHDRLDKEMDKEIADLKNSNDQFKKDIDAAVEEVVNSKQTLRETLEDILVKEDSSPIDIENAKAMLKAINDMESLHFLENNNYKTIKKIIRNEKEYNRIKNKALKLINRNTFEEPIPYNFFEVALKRFVSLDPELTEANRTLMNNIILIITVRFYMFISKTKRLGVYEKACILYFKTFLVTSSQDKEFKSLDNAKFKENLTEYFKGIIEQTKQLSK